jgi:hypothetical protein
MRYALLMAALLACAAAPNAALAFESDATTNTNPDGSQRYVDPDESAQFGLSDSGSSSSSLGRGSLFGSGVISGYTGSSDSAGSGNQPWLAPRSQPGR